MAVRTVSQNNNTPLAEPPVGHAISELRHDERGVRLSIPDEGGEQTLIQSIQDRVERQPTYQQVNESEGNASSYSTILILQYSATY